MVVPTRNRAELLGDLVAALQRQTMPAEELEVILADDASDDATPTVIAELAAESDTSVRGVRTAERSGPAGARNAGWRAARGEIVAFTDDDCLPDVGWAVALAAAVDGGAELVQGRTVPRADQLDRRGPWSRTIHVEEEVGHYQTCNMAYRRGLLASLGGFDEAYQRAGEDTDLAWRAIEAGAAHTFAADAVVAHAVSRSRYLPYLRDRSRWGEVVRLVRDHPEYRACLHRRYFYRYSHKRAAKGTLIVAATAGLHPVLAPVGAGCALGFRLSRTRGEGPAPSRAARELAAYVADCYEIAVVLRANIRYRTLLL